MLGRIITPAQPPARDSTAGLAACERLEDKYAAAGAAGGREKRSLRAAV
jgi:hypothetical protein